MEDLQTAVGLDRVKEWAGEVGLEEEDILISANTDEVRRGALARHGGAQRCTLAPR